MTNSIPANALVSVQPNVLSAGGSPLSLNGVFITQDTSIPLGTVQPFSTLTDVSNWFGAGAPETALAAVYFLGFDNSNIKPGTLYFARYNASAASAYTRGTSLSSMTLAQLQALSGTIIVTLDGTVRTSAAINLAGATSFSNAAVLMTTGLGFGTVTYDTLRKAFVITSSTTGATSTISYATGTLSPSVGLTQATGAVLSQGAAAQTPAGMMNSIVAVTQNWATFMTTYEPNLTDKTAFATWTVAQNLRYLYASWDTDATATASGNTTSFGPVTATYDGVAAIWGPADKAAWLCGATASIDFNETNGRITFAYKGQSGLTPDVTNQTIAANLIANGYNFYGSYATANQQFQFFQPGQLSGRWDWVDPYINQIYLNSQFQLALMEFLAASKSVPYNNDGYGGIRSAMLDPINQGLRFGSIRAGVTLSSAQISEVNTAAGVNIAGTLAQQGWYLQILDAPAQVRGLRGSPPMKFWYTDGGSIHTINLASIDVQ